MKITDNPFSHSIALVLADKDHAGDLRKANLKPTCAVYVDESARGVFTEVVMHKSLLIYVS